MYHFKPYSSVQMFPLVSEIVFLLFSFTFLTLANVFGDNFDFIDLPDSHVPYYLHNFPDIASQCEVAKSSCPYQRLVQNPAEQPSKVCWGYEADCNRNNSFSSPRCPGTQIGWTETKGQHVDIFYEQADFGKLNETASYPINNFNCNFFSNLNSIKGI